MNFGERIYELRSKAGLSQGELADSLDVSRQAVSKWENNSAVPELDKLLKMSELFSVSLDGLVKGTITEESVEENIKNDGHYAVLKASFPQRKIAALVLFGMGFFVGLAFMLLGGLFGLLYAVPFVVLGLICWFSERHTFIRCLWAALFMINAFCRWATGVSVSAVLYTFSWTYEMNYLILVFSWVLLLFNVFTVLYTAVKLGKEAPEKPEKLKKNLIASVSVSALVFALNAITGELLSRLYENSFDESYYRQVFSFVLGIFGAVRQYAAEIVIAVALICIIRYIRAKRA